jgi:hypothetical protein
MYKSFGETNTPSLDHTWAGFVSPLGIIWNSSYYQHYNEDDDNEDDDNNNN